MASIFRPVSVICMILFMANGVTSIPRREFDSMVDTLRVRGYDLFCNAIVTSDLQFELLSYANTNTNSTRSFSFTFFAPTDASLFALDMTQTASSYTDTLRFHVIPRRLSIAQLRLLPDGYTLPTLLPQRRLDVTRRPSSTAAIAVGGVDIAFPGLFYGREVAVHGLAGILSLRSNAASGFASNPPSPLLVPPNHTVLAPSSRPVDSPVPKFVSFNVTSRPGSPPSVENIPPVHAPAPGPTAVTRQAPAYSPVNRRVREPEPDWTIHSPAPEPAAFLGDSPISSHSYVLTPVVSPAISETPGYPGSAISSPPVGNSDADVPAPLGLHVWVRKKDSVSLIETFTGDSKGMILMVKDGKAEKSEPLEDDIRKCVTSDLGLGLQHSVTHDHVRYMQCYAA